MFKNYITTAFRNFKRNKAYSFINILGLSIGLAAAMLIILYVKDEVSYDGFHKNLGSIYRVTLTRTKPGSQVGEPSGITGYFQGPRFTANVPEIQSFVRLQEDYHDVKIGQDITSQQMLAVDANFFSVFSFPLLSGNPKTVLLSPNDVVLSEETAKRIFNTIDAVGKTLTMKNQDGDFVPYLVSGVAKRCPQNSSIKFDMVVPMQVSKQDMARNDNWLNSFLNTFVVVSPGTELKSVEAKMNKTFQREAGESIKMAAEKYADSSRSVFGLQPFADMHLNTSYGGGNGISNASNPVFSYILSGIALFVLMIACINFVNLTVARSIKRAKEIGIRKVIGSSRKQLIVQFLGETFLLGFMAFVLAIILVQLVLPVFNDLSNKALRFSYLFDLKLVCGYILLFTITSFLAGFYPAVVLSAYDPVATLYNRFSAGRKNYLQKALVILQFSLASFLIIATLTIYLQFRFLTNEKLGYDDTNLIAVDYHSPSTRHSEVAVLKQKLLLNPAITGVAAKNGGSWETLAHVNGAQEISFAYETVNEDFLPLLKVPVINGRNFSKDYPSDSVKSVIVNETFAKKAGWKNPIGQEVDFWYNPGQKYNVIGVAKDYHFEALTKQIGPQLFTMNPGNQYGRAFIRIRPNSAGTALSSIQKTFKSIFPLQPYSYRFIDQQNLQNYEAEAKWKQIILFGAILTIFISCIGLFGLSVLSAEKRTKEVGIRKVLGASVQQVVAILSADFLKLVVLSLLISIPLAWLAADKWLQNYPYRITISWWIFAGAGALVIMVAMSTVSFQAIKAAFSNPVKSLRTE